jgi:predicted DNA-binding transcriptional regulator YafY
MRAKESRAGTDGPIAIHRAGRLYQLLRLLAERPRSRRELIRRGRAGLRTFYRDLNVLLNCEIEICLNDGRYELDTPFNDALGRLPFPVIDFTFAEAMQLAKTKGTAQQKIKTQLAAIVKSADG